MNSSASDLLQTCRRISYFLTTFFWAAYIQTPGSSKGKDRLSKNTFEDCLYNLTGLAFQCATCVKSKTSIFGGCLQTGRVEDAFKQTSISKVGLQRLCLNTILKAGISSIEFIVQDLSKANINAQRNLQWIPSQIIIEDILRRLPLKITFKESF